MTRLSDALKRAAESAGAPLPPTPEAAAIPSWQFDVSERMQAAPAAPLNVESSATAERLEPPRVAPAVREPSTPVPNTSIRVGDADRHKLVITEGLDSALIEQYRHLAAVLHHGQEKSGLRSVMVTSAVPNEGKTLTATNLALTLSQSYRRRVLLIDADLRRPRLREMFALPVSEGLVDVLGRPAGGALPLHQVSRTLSVLTAGRVVTDPMSMLVSPAMKQLLDEARDAFDWIVVDTPPIAILPDANLLSAMIDTALLVVSAQSTPYPMVQRAAQAIGTGRILGVVLNRAEHAAVPVYDYGYPGYTPASQKTSMRWWRRLRKTKRVTSISSTASPSAAEQSLG